jgi:subtilase family serine protease
MRTRTLLAGIAGTTLVIGGLSIAATVTAGAAPRPGRVVEVAGTNVSWAQPSAAEGALSDRARLSVQLWLGYKLAAASAFSASVSEPGSVDYRHYLSPNAYTSRFGPSASSAATVSGWLQREGFTDVHVDAERAYVSASASASTVDRAFRVQEVRYKASASAHAYDGALFANDRAVTLPASVAADVVGVTGLDNQAALSTLIKPPPKKPKLYTQPCSHYFGQHIARYSQPYKGQRHFSTELCGYTATQLRAAYGASTSATGKGVTVALVELGLVPNMYLTLEDYAKTEGMPKPVASRYQELSLGAGSRCGDPFDIEEQLDVESTYDMAPGANLLVVGGNSCGPDEGLGGLFQADEAILDGNGVSPLASIASNSWGSGDEGQPTTFTAIEHGYLVRAVAEGVGMYFSSGDGPGVYEPASDPDVVAVGGTSLGVAKSGSRLFETGWSDGFAFRNGKRWSGGGDGLDGAAGGGASELWSEPTFQVGVVPTSLTNAGGDKGVGRAVPDISADADEYTGFRVGFLVGKHDNIYRAFAVGGTSEASPLVAGSVAAAQQGESTAFGFLDPLLYKLAGTSAFHATLPVTSKTTPFRRSLEVTFTELKKDRRKFQFLSTFDDQSANAGTSQVTLPGYDTMTGLGTPRGAAFRAALRSLAGVS